MTNASEITISADIAKYLLGAMLDPSSNGVSDLRTLASQELAAGLFGENAPFVGVEDVQQLMNEAYRATLDRRQAL